jgi:arsenite/tail-anchored protein-transporting ATPase
VRTEFVFFSGKGGVGKTTMACATAVSAAESGRRTLIVTTDPASNLADVFEQPIGHRVTAIDGVPNLWALEIDPQKATEEYRERVLGPVRAVMPADVLAAIEEHFSSPCTTEIASFDRFVDCMDSDDFEVIVFDTAPTGHTLRLLELPVDWSRHIEESAKGTGQTCLGPVQGIEESKAKYDRAIALLTDGERTRFVFVLHPERTALYETERASTELGRIGVRSQELIVNGLLPLEACESPFFRRRYDRQQERLGEIRARFDLPVREMLLRDDEVKGLASLREVAQGLAGEATRAVERASGAATPGPERRQSGLEAVDVLGHQGSAHRAVFFTGKGGVGKTTVSCLTAVHLARHGRRVLLLTTDPAAHIAQVLDVPVGDSPAPVPGLPGLWAAQVDAKQATEEYKASVLEKARGQHSEEMLMALREELESPCTEEIAAFDKFTQYLDSDGFDTVVFDTAPTGHTVRLLALPFDYSQQVELMVSTTPGGSALRDETRARFERLIAGLRDPARTLFAFVLYPESTPVVEAHRASRDLAAAGIATQVVVANQVIPPEQATNVFFRRRRGMQQRYLRDIDARFGVPVLEIPLLEEEPRGIPQLLALAEAIFGEPRTLAAAVGAR